MFVYTCQELYIIRLFVCLHLSRVIYNWAGTREKVPYGCGCGFEISCLKIWSWFFMTSCTCDDRTLSRYWAILVSRLRPYLTSLDSSCLKGFCSFWLTKISCYSAKWWHMKVLLYFWHTRRACWVDLTKTPISQWGSNIFQNGFHWCNLWIIGYKKVQKTENWPKMPYGPFSHALAQLGYLFVYTCQELYIIRLFVCLHLSRVVYH